MALLAMNLLSISTSTCNPSSEYHLPVPFTEPVDVLLQNMKKNVSVHFSNGSSDDQPVIHKLVQATLYGSKNSGCRLNMVLMYRVVLTSARVWQSL